MDIKIETIPVGTLETNCYVVTLDGEVAIIDPGDDSKKIISMVGNKKPRYILITHGHFDHILALDAIADKYKKAQVLTGDVDMIKKLNLQNGFFGSSLPKIKVVITSANDGLRVSFGNSFFEVISTPGHTPDGVTYLIDDHAFTGDTLFSGAYGRVDLPGSDPEKMRASLKKLGQLDPATTVYPGHGRSTTIGNEKMKGIL